jgi:hypothetical protein
MLGLGWSPVNQHATVAYYGGQNRVTLIQGDTEAMLNLTSPHVVVSCDGGENGGTIPQVVVFVMMVKMVAHFFQICHSHRFQCLVMMVKLVPHLLRLWCLVMMAKMAAQVFWVHQRLCQILQVLRVSLLWPPHQMTMRCLYIYGMWALTVLCIHFINHRR